MTKSNSKRTRKGIVVKKTNISKKNKLTSKQEQNKKHVLKGGGPLEVITFENKRGLFTLPWTTHPNGFISRYNKQNTHGNFNNIQRDFSKQSDIWSFGWLIIKIFCKLEFDELNKKIKEKNNDLVELILDKSLVEGKPSKIERGKFNFPKKRIRTLIDLKTQASKTRFESFVKEFINMGKGINGNLKDVIELLVTYIFANSVINFKKDIFGFDKIIELLKTYTQPVINYENFKDELTRRLGELFNTTTIPPQVIPKTVQPDDSKINKQIKKITS